MFIRFEYGAIDKEPLTFTGGWFQITYNAIKDENDSEIAFYDGSFWVLNDSCERYSDIVLWDE